MRALRLPHKIVYVLLGLGFWGVFSRPRAVDWVGTRVHVQTNRYCGLHIETELAKDGRVG